jgi:hypothetical protein
VGWDHVASNTGESLFIFVLVWLWLLLLASAHLVVSLENKLFCMRLLQVVVVDCVD